MRNVKNFYEVEKGQLTSNNIQVGNPVPYVVLLPPNYDSARTEPYPLLLYLHGGGGTADEILDYKSILEMEPDLWGGVAEFVAICFSCPGKNASNTAGGQYLDYADGTQRWDRFVVEEFLPHIQKRYHVGCGKKAKIVALGFSMGGSGVLRLGFNHPELFSAVAAMEPHIHAGLSYSSLNAHQRAIETPHNSPPLCGDIGGWSGSLCAHIRDETYGNPVKEEYWQACQPAFMVIRDPQRLKIANLQIYLECGDRDEFEFNYATEYLHRLLLDHGIEHDYHMLRGVSHYGGDLEKRFLNAVEFLSRQVMPETADPPERLLVRECCAYDVHNRKIAAGYVEQTIAEKYRNLPVDWC